MSEQPSVDESHRFSGFLSLLVVYAVWSTTYLAIRVGVTEGFAPFLFAAVRLIIASAILFSIAAIRKTRIKITLKEFIHLLVAAVIGWILCHTLVVIAEKKVASGLAAVFLGSSPLWAAAIDSVFHRRLPGVKLVLSLLVSFAGVGLVVFQNFGAQREWDLQSVVLLIVAAIMGGLAVVYQKRFLYEVPALSIAAYQHLFAALMLFPLSFFTGEGLPSPTANAWIALTYLTLFGSVLAGTAYQTAIKRLPVAIVTTYAYVNPVLAVILGAVLLNESVGLFTFIGTGLVIAGVAGVYLWTRPKSAS